MAKRTVAIDEKIERAQREVIRAKEKYEAAVTELKELQERKKRDPEQRTDGSLRGKQAHL